MHSNMSTKDIERALDALIASLGLRGPVDHQHFLALAQRNDLTSCAQAIANAMGLPIQVDLSHKPRSSSLVNTDSRGRGNEGISAQVLIHPDLPMIGSSQLQGYRIRIGLSKTNGASPETIVTLLAHELSHVLLTAIRSPHKDCEIHTDLVPLIQGFGAIVKAGRSHTQKHVTCKGQWETTETTTTTYGYLNDSHFECALAHVNNRLSCFTQKRTALRHLAVHVRKSLRRAYRGLSKFKDYLDYLDASPPRKMKRCHTDRVIAIHCDNPAIQWRQCIDNHAEIAQAARSFAEALNHFTDVSVQKADRYTSQMTDISYSLDDV